jgi:hypothetical protein
MKHKNIFWKKYWEKPVNRVVKAMKANVYLANVMNPYTKFLTEDAKDAFYTLVAIFAITPEEVVNDFRELVGDETFDFIMMYATATKVFLNLNKENKQ